MDILEKALELAGRGFYVFPLKADSKLPAIADFPTMASRDPLKIARWWKDPVFGLVQPHNIGISTSRFGEVDSGLALLVVDIDNKGDKKGDDTILELELEGNDLPETYTQYTPTGGRHLVYTVLRSHNVGNSVGLLGSGVDTRGSGGYIVGVGSSISDAQYTANESSPVAAPDWLISQCAKRTPQAEAPVQNSEINKEAAYERAKLYLIEEAPLSVQGEGGDQNAFRVAARAKDFGVDAAVCLELMLEHWNDRCDPPWAVDELATKVNHAYRYGEREAGVDAADAQFPPVDSDIKTTSYLQEMNKQYALLFLGGEHVILFETLDEKKRRVIKLLKESTFRMKFSVQKVTHGKRVMTYAEAWLGWSGRRTYQDIVFAPERPLSPEFYNLWKGFAVDPVKFSEASEKAQKGFKMFKQFTQDIVCNGDIKLFNWLIGYCAQMIQTPYERPLVTLVFQGKKGTGKNTFIDRIGKLLGRQHYLVAHSVRYLTSNFNGHLDSCLCMVLDEAFWSGDKGAEGQLKGLTTAPEIMIERKGKEPYTVDNLTRVVVIGNDKWLVPASVDERRYAVFKFSEDRMQDNAFFEEMRKLMDDEGGNQVLLQYLKDFDLSRIKLNIAPETSGLLDQKMASSEPFYQWWRDCLAEARIIGDDFEEEWPVDFSRERFRGAFRKYVRERNIRQRVPDDLSIGKLIKACLPQLIGGQKREGSGVRRYVYRFPNLEESRRAWSAYIGQPVEWENNTLN